jgi:Major Facilitator Superfamily
VLFTLGSLLCSLAPGLDWLVAFRVLQAIGGSMLNPVALSIVSNTFTDAAERARAIGISGSVFGISLALGGILVAGGKLAVGIPDADDRAVENVTGEQGIAGDLQLHPPLAEPGPQIGPPPSAARPPRTPRTPAARRPGG